MISLVFLVYDSRSGSTYFSRKLDENTSDIVVTPEVNIEYAARLVCAHGAGEDEVVSALERGRFFSSLGVNSSLVRQRKGEFGKKLLRNIVREALGVYCERRGKKNTSTVVIKKGNNLNVWRCLLDVFPESRFIYLRRDPRAVFSSKKRTRRPYYPEEFMGWAGVLWAARVWSRYEKNANRVANSGRMMMIRFEDLASREVYTFHSVCDWLGSTWGDDRCAAGGKGYFIAPKEREIHGKALSSSVDRNAIESWKGELNKFEVSVLEFLLKKSMSKAGYEVSLRSRLWGGLVVPIAVVDFLVRLLMKVKRVFFRKMGWWW
ncbi:sulfotransferase [Arhodomonas aquaeolei]|uniref:sulfotransferase family protein n=1 Tax=Arhodomonas aquaeolei TaxID=2369 RepID=UPI002168785B|nr:sulfotransferase [Arhodomonas aquaeolei]MCS4502496.1 sulfotransferase [Arhodomonas aquaeolei]